MSYYLKVTLFSSLSTGLVWSVIYLLFSRLHRMDEMFNEEFIFVMPKIIGVQVSTITMGFVFSFLDGALFIVTLSFVISFIKRFISK